MATKEQMNWRENIVAQLQQRNHSQTYCYQDLVQQSNYTKQLQLPNLQTCFQTTNCSKMRIRLDQKICNYRYKWRN